MRGCAAGGWCWAETPTVPDARSAGPMPRWTEPWPPCTTAEARAEARVERSGGLGASAPRVARWLGDIRSYFPSTVVQVMQKDAVERLNLTRLLLEPEMLEAVEPDVHLVGTLLSLNRVMPGEGPRVGQGAGPQGRLRAGAQARAEDEGRGDRRAGPLGADPPAQAGRRHRLGPYDPRQPEELPARPQHRDPVEAGRLRPAAAGGPARGRALHRPERLDGRLRRLFERLRRGAGLDALAQDVAGRLRHRGRRPDRPAPRSGRAAVRHPARRRHRHQPGHRLRPGPHHPAHRLDLRPDQRPLRGRRPAGDAPPGRRR